MNVSRSLCLAAVLAAIVGCSDSSDRPAQPEVTPPPPPPPAVEPAQLRVTHAGADAPDVNVYVDGELALEEVAFRQSSGLLTIDNPGSIEVEVRGLLADGSEVTVIGPVELVLEEGVRTDVVAYDTLFDADGELNLKAKVLDPVAIEEDIADVRVSVMLPPRLMPDLVMRLAPLRWSPTPTTGSGLPAMAVTLWSMTVGSSVSPLAPKYWYWQSITPSRSAATL